VSGAECASGNNDYTGVQISRAATCMKALSDAGQLVMAADAFAAGAITRELSKAATKSLLKLGANAIVEVGTKSLTELAKAGLAKIASRAAAQGLEADLASAVNIEAANFAQKTASANFSAEGAFSGSPRAEIVGQLQSGALTAADVQVEVIVRNGQTLILNTRSATALAEAGIPRSAWSVVNMTGDAVAEARLTAQLARNGLTDAGIETVRAK
jgi:hypothetical protein